MILVIDFMVFVVVVWSFIRTYRREKKYDKRVALRDQHTKRAVICLQDGKRLQREVPHPTPASHYTADTDTIIAEWNVACNKWIETTHVFLENCSSQAAVIFMADMLDEPNTQLIAAMKVIPALTALNLRLRNLQSIIDNPDVYL
jgi:hypothetical protein